MKVPKIRLILSVLLLISLPVFNYVYTSVEGPVEGSLAVAQLQDDAVTYAAARRGIVDNAILQFYTFGVCSVLLVVWGTWAYSNRRKIKEYYS